MCVGVFIVFVSLFLCLVFVCDYFLIFIKIIMATGAKILTILLLFYITS